MPRAGGIYSAPAGSDAVTNTTIESAKYNALIADLVTDANAARPITAGGTGAISAIAASDALHTQSSNIASGTTTNLASATGVLVNITGTTAITAFGTVSAGAIRSLIFAGILTLTHDATSLILPTGANITTAAGDVAIMQSLGSGNWKCVAYTRANGQSLAATTPTTTRGDLIYRGASADSRLAKGTEGQYLKQGADDPAWASLTIDDGLCVTIASPSNKSYTLGLKMPFGGTISETTTKSLSGTCTATFKINTTALGGTANSVSSSEQSQAQASANVFVAGDDLVVTISSNSSCVDASCAIKWSRTL